MSTEAERERISTSLSYDETSIGVHLNRAADLAWIADILGPAFSVSKASSPSVEVYFEVDRERFTEIEFRGPATSGGSVDALTLDDSIVQFRLWRDASAVGPRVQLRDASASDSRSTAFDQQYRVFLEIVSPRVLRLTAESGELCRIALLRLIRELAMDAGLRRGDVFLHAASFAVDGVAIVVAGRKKAGKTTTLSWALQLMEHSSFIANDCVRLRSSDAGSNVRGMPTVTTLRQESLELLPSLAEALRKELGQPFHGPTERREREDLEPLRPWSDGRIGLAPSRYPALLGRTSLASAPLGALVFPELALDDGGLRAIAIDPTAAADRIAESLFGAAHLDRRSLFLDASATGARPSAHQLRERARRIAEDVPSYVWKLGTGAPRDAAGLARFLRKMKTASGAAKGF